MPFTASWTDEASAQFEALKERAEAAREKRRGPRKKKSSKAAEARRCDWNQGSGPRLDAPRGAGAEDALCWHLAPRLRGWPAA